MSDSHLPSSDSESQRDEEDLAINNSVLGPPDRVPMLRQVVVSGVGVKLPETFGRVVLGELDGSKRSFSIPISLEQAGIIAGLREGRKAPRPMTGDLFCEVLEAFSLGVEVIQITGKANGVYLAQMTITGASSQPKVFPCRPSDGIIIALGQPLPVPILADEMLLG